MFSAREALISASCIDSAVVRLRQLHISSRTLIQTYLRVLPLRRLRYVRVYKSVEKRRRRIKRKRKKRERESSLGLEAHTHTENNQIEETLGEEEKKNLLASMLSVSLSPSLTSNSAGRERVRTRERERT